MQEIELTSAASAAAASNDLSAVVAGCEGPESFSRGDGLHDRGVASEAQSADSSCRDDEGIEDEEVLVRDAEVLVHGVCLALL